MARISAIYKSDVHNEVIFIPNISHATIGAGTADADYYKGWYKYFVRSYPNRGTTIFIGTTNPNSMRFTIGYCYGTTSDNVVNGVPKYCSLLAFHYNQILTMCGYSDGVWFIKTWS